MEENNVMPAHAENTPNFDGHPTQAHADHATIMKAHEVIRDPGRMSAVHALHGQGGGLIDYLKKKQKDFSMKESQQHAAAEPGETAHEESAEGDHDSDMTPQPTSMMGTKKAAQVK